MRRPAILVLLAGLAAAAVTRRRRSRGDGREIWNEATTAPDLR